jgi:hypothetical protein
VELRERVRERVGGYIFMLGKRKAIYTRRRDIAL